MPSLLPSLGEIVLGITLLGIGGEGLVRGAVSLARLLRVSTAVIGLTIVAMGTSAPELAVSLFAAAHGKADIAVGNVVGSNIFNVAVIIGLSAVLLPLPVHASAVRLEWPAMFVTCLAGLFVARDGVVDRLDGGFLLVGLAVFTAYMVRLARTETTKAEGQVLAAAVERHTLRTATARAAIDLGFVALGVGLLVLGANVLVRGAVGVAQLAGWSDRIIGLTIVSAGTSMPELATSLAAARRKQPDIAIANVLGSNIFNVAGILGTVALVTPQRVAPAVITSDFPWMLAYAFVLWPFMWTGRRVSRLEGVVLLGAYGVYLWRLMSG